MNAGAEVQTQTGRVRKPSRAMRARRGRLSAPWLRFHGANRADVYIIIRVRASCCGECALNPPTSQPIPRRSPSLAHAQRHALPEALRSPTQPRRTPTQPRRTPAGCAMHSPPTSPPILRRRPSLAPTQRHALPEHFLPPRSADARPQAARCTPAALTTHSPSKICSRPRTATRPSRALPLAPAAPMHARRPHNPFPAQRHAASPSVPLRAQKNGIAQCMCDAECLGRPSLRSVIWVGEPRAVRRRCGALAYRRGLRPQPWALRSRRCGRVLRA